MSKPKSAQQKINEGRGSLIGVHKLDRMLASEPKVEKGLPAESPRLKGAAAEAYRFYVRQLEQSELAAQPDIFALERACQNLAMIWKADRALARQGPVIRIPIMAGIGDKRRRVGWRQSKNRWLSVRLEAEKAFYRFAGSFGVLGPASRTSLNIEHANKLENDQELWALLTAPRPKREPEVAVVIPERKSDAPLN